MTDDVRAYMNSLGFFPEEIVPDGKVHRFARDTSKDAAWCIVWQNARIKDGTFYNVAMFGDWRTGERHSFQPEKLSREDKKTSIAQIKQRQAEAEMELIRRQGEAAIEVERRYSAAQKIGTTPYMESKLIPELYGAVIYRECVQIPMRDIDGKIWGLQTIFPDGQKRFMNGSRKKKCFHAIGDLTAAKLAYVVEGYATASSVHQATGKVVVVAFDAGNVPEVVLELRRAYPAMSLIVCGDNDPAGRAAVEKSGVPGVFPPPEVNDFNDLHAAKGLEAVRQTICQTKIPPKTTGFVALGFDDARKYFFSFARNAIVRMTSFTPVQFLDLAPLDYWAKTYPTEKGTPNWLQASSELIRQCESVGHFDINQVRTIGFWRDEGRLVNNTGEKLFVDNVEMALTEISSRHIYLRSERKLPKMSAPLKPGEGTLIVGICESFNWRRPVDGALLAGWLMIARIAGGLPVRPHIWITGGKGSGKSTLLEKLISPCLGNPQGKMQSIGGTTEAGIRQTLATTSIPLIADEFESLEENSKKRNQAVLELLRTSWSIGGGKIVKGTPSGVPQSFGANSAALLCSIRVNLTNDADRSRFSVLELMPHGDNPEAATAMHARLALLSEAVGERLFASAAALAPHIEASFKVMAPILAKTTTQRFADQHGMLFAGYWFLLNPKPVCISLPEAEHLVPAFLAAFENEAQDDEESDEEECLNHLVTSTVVLDRGARISIAEGIRNHAKEMQTYGIKVLGGCGKVLIANSHVELRKIFADTRWEGNWAASLRRLKGAERKNPTSFGSREAQSKAIAIPMSLI